MKKARYERGGSQNLLNTDWDSLISIPQRNSNTKKGFEATQDRNKSRKDDRRSIRYEYSM